jgi:mRNA-degrading endonuclease YafQ of YafQ-DinJ toxin-antitoxin module
MAAQVTKTLVLLGVNLLYPSLRLHKLSGTQNYSVSVNMSIRIIFHKDQDYLYLLRIGTHEEVYA